MSRRITHEVTKRVDPVPYDIELDESRELDDFIELAEAAFVSVYHASETGVMMTLDVSELHDMRIASKNSYDTAKQRKSREKWMRINKYIIGLIDYIESNKLDYIQINIG